MLKKTVKYVNFNDIEVIEDYYFNLTTVELTRLQAKFGDIAEYAKKLADSKNQEAMIQFIEDLIISSYGVKSANGRSFIKNAQVREEFEYSQAYAEIFEELLLNPQMAMEFGQGLIKGAAESGPQDHQKKRAEVQPLHPESEE